MTDPIELTVEAMWCPRHREPFRARWPKGYALATPALFSAFTRTPAVQRYCGRDDERDQLADSGRLRAALGEFGPACCAVDELLVRRIVRVSIDGDPSEYLQLMEHVNGLHDITRDDDE